MQLDQHYHCWLLPTTKGIETYKLAVHRESGFFCHCRAWIVAQGGGMICGRGASCDTMTFIQSCDSWLCEISNAWGMKIKQRYRKVNVLKQPVYGDSVYVYMKDYFMINTHRPLIFFSFYSLKSFYSKEKNWIGSMNAPRQTQMELFICVRLYLGGTFHALHTNQFIILFIFLQTCHMTSLVFSSLFPSA